MSKQDEKAYNVKKQYATQYLRRPEVTAFGVEKDTTGQYVIAISVDTQDPQILQQFPSDLEGVPVRVAYRGQFRAFPAQ
jgi:hypothetical protein